MQNRIISQNSHYTFKYNSSLGRHGWLRLTPAYSVRLVEEILNELDYKPECVFEPFSGTGTTELVCANRGVKSFAFEINPFLVWFGNTKLKIYSGKILDEFLVSVKRIVSNIKNSKPSDLPPIYNFNRWWGDGQAEFLSKLKTSILNEENNIVQQLLWIAFCRTVIEFSNAAFNHVSTSFSDTNDYNFDIDNGTEYFIAICNMVLETARMQPILNTKIYNIDSKNIPSMFNDSFDTVITSPPYPNRISYIRELRPYMYWLDYLQTSEQAGELDWSTIGGTWGKATSKLSTWNGNNDLPSYIYDLASKISNAENKSSELMANYVLKYFEDIQLHLSSVFSRIKSKGKVHYIIGNSNFYGVTVPSEKLYIDMMDNIGFINSECRIVRKRNSNKQLYEYVVMAQKP